MARRKTLPESLRAKLSLAERLAGLRLELFGERGGPEMARRLQIPVRTWYNYEGGVTVPAEVVLRIIELTSVEPVWLLHGKGPKFRQTLPIDRSNGSHPPQPSMTVSSLLRSALQLLENEGNGNGTTTRIPGENSTREGGKPSRQIGLDGAVSRLEDVGREEPFRVATARREWIEAQQDDRCIQVMGDAMSPVVAEGASVAYSKFDEEPSQLDGKMVVVWLDGQPRVRWFQHCGRYALLRAENPTAVPQQTLIDMEDPVARPRISRVLWIDTPH